MVLQWLPDNRTAVAHKVSGSYRFHGREPMVGEVRRYNFGSQCVPNGADCGSRPQPALGRLFRMIRILVAFTGWHDISQWEVYAWKESAAFRARWEAEFDGDDGSRSPLSFGLETTPELDDFIVTPLKLTAVPGGRPVDLIFADYRISSVAGPWIGTNGVAVDSPKGNGAWFHADRVVGRPDGRPLPTISRRPCEWSAEGFLVVQPIVGPSTPNWVFASISWMNWGNGSVFGRISDKAISPPRRELWLNLNDFHVYFGVCSTSPEFRPKEIRELQLRFYSRHLVETRSDFRFYVGDPKIASIERS